MPTLPVRRVSRLAPRAWPSPALLPSALAAAEMFRSAGWWRQLAATGPLLWQFAGDDPLALLYGAQRCEPRARLGSEGLLEWLWLDGPNSSGALYLLPDSDYLAWDWLMEASAPGRAAPGDDGEGGCAALLRRRLRSSARWRFEVLACAPLGPDRGPRVRAVEGLSAVSRAVVERVVGQRG